MGDEGNFLNLHSLLFVLLYLYNTVLIVPESETAKVSGEKKENSTCLTKIERGRCCTPCCFNHHIRMLPS